MSHGFTYPGERRHDGPPQDVSPHDASEYPESRQQREPVTKLPPEPGHVHAVAVPIEDLAAAAEAIRAAAAGELPTYADRDALGRLAGSLELRVAAAPITAAPEQPPHSHRMPGYKQALAESGLVPPDQLALIPDDAEAPTLPMLGGEHSAIPVVVKPGHPAAREMLFDALRRAAPAVVIHGPDGRIVIAPLGHRAGPIGGALTAVGRELAYTIADSAIGMFLEYRDQHGHPEDGARPAAALEIAAAAAVTDAEIGVTPDPAMARMTIRLYANGQPVAYGEDLRVGGTPAQGFARWVVTDTGRLDSSRLDLRAVAVYVPPLPEAVELGSE